jgi:hypothetical protein
MEPEKRKTGVEGSLLESDYAGLEMAQRWPAFARKARKCLSVQFAVLGSVTRSYTVHIVEDFAQTVQGVQEEC